MVQMKDKGPNDLEKKIYALLKENLKLNEQNDLLKKEIAFLREEIQADNLTKIINCKKEM
jgi:cell division septum initiation protein DivIVA